MGDVVVFKTAHHMDDGVYLADVGEKFVAEALALGGAAHQPCDVHKFDNRRGYLLRMVHLGEDVEPPVRHCDHADIRLNGAEGVVCALRSCVCDRVEEGALSDVRQPDDSEFHISLHLLNFSCVP